MSRYERLINSIAATDKFILGLCLFALGAVAAYSFLGWVENEHIRNAARGMFAAFILAAFIFVTVYSGGL